MNSTIWHTVAQKTKEKNLPIMILAPMEDVTDTVFRRIVMECGRPDLFFTEFVNADGICSPGYQGVSKRLKFENIEKPLIAQIWGNNPVHYSESIKLLKEQGFDGIDINMGCPERSVVSKGCCSALIKDKPLAKELIQTAKEAAGNLPVSVKTRIGYNEIATEEWLGFLLEQDITALTVHGRTTKEMSLVPAHWDEIGKAVKLRDTMKKDTLIIGNGDVQSYEDALLKYHTFGVDGIMIGRGIFHNPWVFNADKPVENITVQEKIELLIKHITLFDTTWGKTKPYHILKKYFKIYISGFPDAANIREELMNKETPQDAITFLNQFLSTSPVFQSEY